MILPPQRITGLGLRSVARAAENRVGARAIYEVLRGELGIPSLAALPDGYRGLPQGRAQALQGRPPRTPHDAELPPPRAPWSPTSESLLLAYRERKITPVEIVSRALAHARELASRTPSYGPLHEYGDTDALKEAEDSAERYRSGAPRGALDGVPFVVKEEIAVRGYRVQAGTAFMDDTPAARDATVVERLRAAGAIVLGTTMMTEYGLSPVGFNPHRKMPHNPHEATRACGGSSTGTAVAVATGLVPFGLGGDGGGSIRIPAAMTGVFGLKPTWGRVSLWGDVYTGSVGHLGPLASSTADLARSLEIIGPPDAMDPETSSAPRIERGSLGRALGRGVKGLRIGIPESEWAEASADVARACHDAARALEREGAVLVPFESALTPFAAPIGYLVLGLESCSALQYALHNRREELGDDVVVSVSALSHVPAIDYVNAQKLRTGLRHEMARLFQDLDLIAFPTTKSTAIPLSSVDWENGFLDSRAIEAMCRFTFLGNMTGLPASSAPVGLDRDGLPIGFQLMGDAWDEATVLAATAHLERIEVARVERPRVAVDLR